MIYQLFGISWATAHYFFYLLPCLLFGSFLLTYRVCWQKKTATLLESDQKLLRNFSVAKKIAKMFLLFLALCGLAFALARPQWDDTRQVVAQEGRDVLIALDISRSMLAQDVKPSRLEAAKKKIKQLVSRFGAERVCLMVFSGVSFIQCPFTTDIGAFLSFLDLVDVESISSGSTALDKALEKAVETFSNQPTKKHKIVVIVTDGEDFSPSAQATKEKIANLGLSIFTIGVGTPEGAPIPLIDENGNTRGHVRQARPDQPSTGQSAAEDGQIVITRLNEPLLKKMAQDTGGRYVRATMDNEHDIEQLVDDVKHFEKEKFEDRLVSAKQEKYYIFAALSFLCLLTEWIL